MNTLEARIRNKLEDIPRVLDLVATLGAKHNLPQAAVLDMNVALDEVLSNIIKYAYTDESIHEIELRMTASEDEVTVEVKDDGRPFDPLSVPPPELDRPLAERRVGGLGIHFVRHLTSGASYSRVAGCNRLIIRIALGSGRDDRGDA